MKVLILTDGFPPEESGGAAVIAYNQVVSLQKKGVDVVVVTTSRTGERKRRLTSEGMTMYTLRSSYNLFFRSYVSLHNRPVLRMLDEILEAEKPDIIHAHNFHTYISYGALPVAARHTTNIFLTTHDSMPFFLSKLHPGTIGAQEGSVKSYRVRAFTQFSLFKLA